MINEKIAEEMKRDFIVFKKVKYAHSKLLYISLDGYTYATNRCNRNAKFSENT